VGDLEFAAELVNSLAWPVVVTVAVVLLRPELADALHRLSSLEFLGMRAKMEFPSLPGLKMMVEAAAGEAGTAPDVPIAKSEETEFSVLNALAAAAPGQAVIDAWGLLEYQLNVVSDQLAPDGQHGWPQVAFTLNSWPMWPRLQPAVEELRRLRDYTVRSRRQPSAEDAARYVAVVQDLVTTLRSADLPGPGSGNGSGCGNDGGK
jgi:hypothetical protein